MRRILFVVLTLLLVLGVMSAAVAVTSQIGNDAIDRQYADSWTNFTIIDTNNPVMYDGYFDEVTFYAARDGFINFVVVDSDGYVTYISEEFEVTTAQIDAVVTVSLSTPAGVTAGDNLGYYTKYNGVIPHDRPLGEETLWTTNAYGPLTVGDMFPDDPTYAQHRVYSLNATVHATSPDICKKGGWEDYGYKNQGQCIASIVANENAGK